MLDRLEPKRGLPPSGMILAQLTSDDVVVAAYDWLCRRRRDYPPNADIWSFRRSWHEEKVRLKAALRAECSELPASAVPQSHGRKSVVRGLLDIAYL